MIEKAMGIKVKNTHFLKKDFIFRERRKEGEREAVVASPAPPLGTWPVTQGCDLTRNRIGDPLVHRLALNPLSHTSQSKKHTLLMATQSTTIFPSNTNQKPLKCVYL